MPTATKVKVGGKVFRIVQPEDLDLQQDGYLAAVLERAGLTDPRLKGLKGEALIHEGQLRLYERGKVGAFVAGYLVEPKTSWSIEHAHTTATLIDDLKDRAARDEIFGLVGGLLTGFFAFAESSQSSGPSSSPAPEPDLSTEPAAASISASGSP